MWATSAGPSMRSAPAWWPRWWTSRSRRADEIAKNFDQTRDQILEQRRRGLQRLLSGIMDDYKKNNRIRSTPRQGPDPASKSGSKRRGRIRRGCGLFGPVLLWPQANMSDFTDGLARSPSTASMSPGDEAYRGSPRIATPQSRDSFRPSGWTNADRCESPSAFIQQSPLRR